MREASSRRADDAASNDPTGGVASEILATPTTPFATQRLELLQTQIGALQQEMVQRERTYHHQKEWMNESFTHYEAQYRQEKQVLSQKIGTLLQETHWQNEQWTSDLSTLNATWQAKWQTALPSLVNQTVEKALEQERSDRNAAWRDMEEQLNMRDQEVEALLDLVAQQGEDLSRAKVERNELSNEIKRVLVTVGVQFEHLMGLTTQQSEDLSKLREEKSHALDQVLALSSELGNVRALVLGIQDEAKQTTQKYSNVQSEIERHCKVAWIGQQADLLDEVQSLSNSLETVASEMTSVRQIHETVQREQDGVLVRLEDTASKLQTVTEQGQQCQSQVQKLQSVVTTIHCQQDQCQANLATMSQQCQKHYETQTTANAKLQGKHDKHKDNLRIVCSAVESNSEQLADLVQRTDDHRLDHTTLQTTLTQAVSQVESKLAQGQQHVQTLQSKLDTQWQRLQHRDQAQILQAKDFAAKYAELERQMSTWNQHLAEWQENMKQQLLQQQQQRSVQQEESVQTREATSSTQQTLDEAAAKQMVEGILQPWLTQYQSLEDAVKRQAKSLARVTADTLSAKQANDSVVQKVDIANKTWESLFQHLAAEVKKDASGMTSTKDESENILREVKALVSTWEVTLSQLSSPQKDITTLLQGHKLGMDSLQAKIDESNIQIVSLTNQLAKQQSQQSSYQLLHAQLQDKLRTLESRQGVPKASNSPGNDETYKLAMRTNVKVEKWKAAFEKHVHKVELNTQELRGSIQDLKTSFMPGSSTQSDRTTMSDKAAAFRSAVGINRSDLQMLEKQLVDTSESLQKTKYENSSLRLQLMGTSGNGQLRESAFRVEDEQREE